MTLSIRIRTSQDVRASKRTKFQWGIRIFFLHCKNGRALVLPVDMRRKGEDGLGQFGPALFACKALPFVSCKKKMPMPHSTRIGYQQNQLNVSVNFFKFFLHLSP